MKYKIWRDDKGTIRRKMTLKDGEVAAVIGIIGLTCPSDRADIYPALNEMASQIFGGWYQAERSAVPDQIPYHIYRESRKGKEGELE